MKIVINEKLYEVDNKRVTKESLKDGEYFVYTNNLNGKQYVAQYRENIQKAAILYYKCLILIEEKELIHFGIGREDELKRIINHNIINPYENI